MTTTGVRPAPAPESARNGRRSLPLIRLLILPFVVLVLAGGLTLANVNGSSAALNGPDWRTDDSLLAGTPRTIRSDEWHLYTPNTIGNARRGLPVQPWIGLTPTFVPAAGLNIPSSHWTQVFRPADAGFFVASASRAFTFRWWAMLGGGIVGVYFLLAALTRRLTLSAALAVVACATPFTAWWSITPAYVMGSLAAAGACVIAGMGSRRRLAPFAWGAAAAYLAVGPAMILYPPWQIPSALMVLAVIAGVILDRRPALGRVLATLGTGAVVVGVVLGSWYLSAREGIKAQYDTDYPGHRISEAGKGNLAWLLDAPSSLWLSAARPLGLAAPDYAADGSRMGAVNQSEISSVWLPIPLLAVAALVLLFVGLRRRRNRRVDALAATEATDPAPGAAGPLTPDEDRPLLWTAWLALGMTALIVAWAILPLPQIVGTVTLLDRVPGYRTPLAPGLGAVIVVGILGAELARRKAPWWVLGLLALGAVATAASMVWATGEQNWVGGRPGTLKVAVVAGVVALGFAAVLSGRLQRVSAIGLAVVTFAVFALVSPLNKGLGPLDTDPVVTNLLEVRRESGQQRVAVYDPRLIALVTASGVENLSGLTIYPDAEVMTRLLPTTRKSMWNIYAKYNWTIDRAAPGGAEIRPVNGTQRELAVDPCSAAVRGLGVSLAVTTEPADDVPCFRLERSFPWTDDGKTTVYLYATN